MEKKFCVRVRALCNLLHVVRYFWRLRYAVCSGVAVLPMRRMSSYRERNFASEKILRDGNTTRRYRTPAHVSDVPSSYAFPMTFKRIRFNDTKCFHQKTSNEPPAYAQQEHRPRRLSESLVPSELMKVPNLPGTYF